MTTGFLTPGDGEEKVPISVEVCLKRDSPAALGEAEAAVRAYLGSLSQVRYREAELVPTPGDFPYMDANVESIQIVDLTGRVAHNKRCLGWDVAWDVSEAHRCTQPGTSSPGCMHPPRPPMLCWPVGLVRPTPRHVANRTAAPC